MALKLSTAYPGRATPPSADYPEGSFKNESVMGADDGTPLEATWQNDTAGFLQGLLSKAGNTASGEADTVPKGQYVASLLKLVSASLPIQASAAMLCGGLSAYGCYASSPDDDSSNFADFAVGITDAALGWDYETSTPFLWVVNLGDKVSKMTGPWDYNNPPDLGSPEALDFPTTPDMVLALCCDGPYLYVAWAETGGDIQVTKFNAETLAEVHTTDTGVTSDEYDDRIRLIVADADNLALLLPGNCDDGTDVGYGVAIISKSTGAGYAATSKAADVGVSFSPESGALVSDGTAVYFLFIDNVGGGTREYTLSRTVIATRATSLTSIRVCTVPDWATYPGGLVAVGPGRILIPCPNGEADLYDSGDVYNQFDLDKFGWGDTGSSEFGVPIGFDGLNVWIGLLVTGEQSGAYYRASKVPTSFCAPILGETPPTAHNTIDSDFVAVEGISTRPSIFWPGAMVYDGRDMWVVNPDGKVARIVNPGAR